MKDCICLQTPSSSHAVSVTNVNLISECGCRGTGFFGQAGPRLNAISLVDSLTLPASSLWLGISGRAYEARYLPSLAQKAFVQTVLANGFIEFYFEVCNSTR